MNMCDLQVFVKYMDSCQVPRFTKVTAYVCVGIPDQYIPCIHVSNIKCKNVVFQSKDMDKYTIKDRGPNNFDSWSQWIISGGDAE